MKRLTKKGKNSFAELKSYLYVEKAIDLLYQYENTGFTPKEIMDLQETIHNLRNRIKKLEAWE